jgi:tRNA(Ile)-lysidine synthase
LRKPKPDSLVAQVAASAARLRLYTGIGEHLEEAVCVGFSGGLDSTVLLHALHQISGFRVSALHVHHGLSPNADAWAAHCEAVCQALGVPFALSTVKVSRLARQSLEEEARRARRRAYARTGVAVVALAHHADDQAETVLLQLLRGAGPQGLAGMAEMIQVGAPRSKPQTFWRPLLDQPRAALREYAERHALQWIEDESNADEAIKRNFLRRRVMPLIEAGFANSAVTLSRAARLQAQTATLLTAQAEEDLEKIVSEAAGTVLEIPALLALGALRAAAVLRLWLAQQGVRAPSEARLKALIDSLFQSSRDTRLRWEHEGLVIKRMRDQLTSEPASR